MQKMEIVEQLRSVFDRVTSNHTDVEIDENTSLFDNLSLDSLDRVEILFEIEQTFSISITDEEAKELRTVSDIIELINSKK